MDDLDPTLGQAVQAQHDGRYDEALRCLLEVSGRVLASEAPSRADEFITMFEWQLLTEAYAPAREALARVRDAEVARLLAGDARFAGGDNRPGSRFTIVVKMNELLGDAQATRDLFVGLVTLAPAQARQLAYRALPAIVAAGDFALAERYLARDPLARLDELNDLAQRLPLFPPEGGAPRLAAELSNFVQDVRLCAATWDGLGRGAEASELRMAALAGLASDEMRVLARRELAEPGTIHRETAAHQMAQEDARDAAGGVAG